MLVRHDVPLAPLTTLGLGGPARRLVTAYEEDELVAAVRQADAADEPVLVLGGGSNVVVADEGFAGTVVQVAVHGLSARAADPADDGSTLLRVRAGEDWDALVALCVRDGLVGIEAMAGVPGLIGATPVQNVGAYGQDVSQTVASVRAYDRRVGEVVELTAQQCAFGYRHSAFKADPGRWVVLAVTYRLAIGQLGAPVRYAELARVLGVPVGGRAPLAQVREAVLGLRRGKGMVVDPADPDSHSAGSFFTNPQVDADGLAELAERVRERLGDVDLPGHPDGGGRTKLSAAWLIERAGFARGYGAGPVGLSDKHVLALVHRGGGSTRELLALAREVRDGVRDAFGVELVPEPVLVGGIGL